MIRRHEGYRYDQQRPVKSDAALIRADIRTMVAAGMLPADWKYSVRYRSFAGGCAIDILAKSPRPVRVMDSGMVAAAPDRARVVMVPLRQDDGTTSIVPLRLRAGERHDIRVCDVTTNEARAVSSALSDLHNAYNHDGSDAMTDYFDVKFYGGATLDTLPGVPMAERPRPSYLPASCDLGRAS